MAQDVAVTHSDWHCAGLARRQLHSEPPRRGYGAAQRVGSRVDIHGSTRLAPRRRVEAHHCLHFQQPAPGRAGGKRVGRFVELDRERVGFDGYRLAIRVRLAGHIDLEAEEAHVL